MSKREQMWAYAKSFLDDLRRIDKYGPTTQQDKEIVEACVTTVLTEVLIRMEEQ